MSNTVSDLWPTYKSIDLAIFKEIILSAYYINIGGVSISNVIGPIRTVQLFHLVKWKYMYQNLN